MLIVLLIIDLFVPSAGSDINYCVILFVFSSFPLPPVPETDFGAGSFLDCYLRKESERIETDQWKGKKAKGALLSNFTVMKIETQSSC